jgi:hypothetical protein
MHKAAASVLMRLSMTNTTQSLIPGLQPYEKPI